MKGTSALSRRRGVVGVVDVVRASEAVTGRDRPIVNVAEVGVLVGVVRGPRWYPRRSLPRRARCRECGRCRRRRMVVSVGSVQRIRSSHGHGGRDGATTGNVGDNLAVIRMVPRVPGPTRRRAAVASMFRSTHDHPTHDNAFQSEAHLADFRNCAVKFKSAAKRPALSHRTGARSKLVSRTSICRPERDGAGVESASRGAPHRRRPIHLAAGDDGDQLELVAE